MKRFAWFGLIVFGFVALAQDRVVTVREANVTPVVAHVTFLPDAGCMVQVESVNGTGVSVQPLTRVFNGARCTSITNAATRAAQLDNGTGDGSVP